jgi:hypothetical protein
LKEGRAERRNTQRAELKEGKKEGRKEKHGYAGL